MIMDPFVTSSIIGGAVNLLGSGLNFGSARKNREMQIQLNRENNQFNAEQAQIQRDWQEQMYAQYQSPQALAQQYEDAGFNKYLAMKGGAGSVGSGSSASSAGTPTLQAPQFDVSSIGETMASVANAIRISKEASWYDRNQIENLNYLRAQGTKLQGDTNWLNLAAKNYKFDPKSAGDMILAQREGEIRRLNLSNDLLRQQEILASLDVDTKRMSNAALPRTIQNDLALQASQISRNLAEVGFTKAKTRSERARVKQIIQDTATSLASMYNIIEQTAGQRLNNEQVRQTFAGYVRAINSANNFSDRRSRYDSDWYSTLQGMFRDSLETQGKILDKRERWYLLEVLFSGLASFGSSVAGSAIGASGRSGPVAPAPRPTYPGWHTPY